jgi:hypothetical protein
LILNKKAIGKKTTEYEDSVQKAVINYLKYAYPTVLYCASAGGVRTSYKQAVKMKQTGYVKGFPDLFIYESRNGYNGLAIELKTLKGVASPEQKEWNKRLIERGYDAHICKGFDAAIQVIDAYLK